MTIAIVIGTHGWAAEQLLKTAEMLLGEQENVGWIDFVPGENAETLIEGLIAGLLGVGLTLVLILPINAVVQHLTDIASLGAKLPWQAGAALVAISMLLTFLAGLIPSSLAAKKDPVVALRTE